MNSEFSLSSIDSLLCQFALRIRELNNNKNEIHRQIEVCRTDVAECKSYTETLNGNIKKLEEEIRMKQSSVIHSKATAKSMKATNSQLLQYEQTLRAELESRRASYAHDSEAFEERIANYKKIFQSHKEHYCQNPLAQKLLRLQGENGEIEDRIQTCDEQIATKQKELDLLTGRAVTFSSSEKLLDSVCCQQPINEPQKQSDPHTEDSDSAIDTDSFSLNQTEMLQSGGKVSVGASAGDMHEDSQVQDTLTCSTEPQEESSDFSSLQELDEQSWPDEMHVDEQKKSVLQDKVLGEEAAGDKDNHQTQNEKDSEGPPVSSPSSVTASPSPTFSLNFSRTSSPRGGTSDIKSPAFPFSLTTDPSTPCFSGFGFDGLMGKSPEEDTFAFTSSLFNKKKTTESKSSGPEFLFNQPEQGEDFQFAFNFNSPQPTDKEKTKDEFPFSFDF